MTHPTDDELEAMAVTMADYCLHEIAATLRALSAEDGANMSYFLPEKMHKSFIFNGLDVAPKRGVLYINATRAASREVHCGIAEHILERGKYPADGPVDTRGIFADSQRARLSIDAALRALEQGEG